MRKRKKIKYNKNRCSFENKVFKESDENKGNEALSRRKRKEGNTFRRLKQVVSRAGWTVNLEMNGVSVEEGYAKGGKTSSTTTTTTTAIKLVLF